MNIPNPKSVLTVDQRDRHHGVCRRACANSEPGFVVYRGNSDAQSVAHFFDEADGIEYAQWKNRDKTP